MQYNWIPLSLLLPILPFPFLVHLFSSPLTPSSFPPSLAPASFLTLCPFSQINHMKKFIEQEAREKADEILIKVMADGEH